MGIAIKVEHLSKEYRLGIINHGVLFRDIQSWIARKTGKVDPHSKIGSEHFADRLDRFWALKDLFFEIEQGERVGIIGRNGAGKSTLLKILSRVTEPTEGIVKIKGRVASLLEVGTGFHPELTGRDNIYLAGAIQGMKKREIDGKIEEIIDFSEIEKFIDTPVKRYSSGMYVRLGFAVAAHLDSEILLADEVLAVGDQAFQKKCLGKMEDVSKNEGRTVIFVSHNMGSVSSLCGKGIFLNKGEKIFAGPIQSTIRKYLEEVDVAETMFSEGLLESACIVQAGGDLVVTANYRDTIRLDTPCLGVKILDFYGNPIFSINPRNYSMIEAGGLLTKRQIKIRITQPKLHDGSYNVSLYLGDYSRDYCVKENCLRVDIKDMVTLKRSANPLHYGPVHPDCEYIYST